MGRKTASGIGGITACERRSSVTGATVHAQAASDLLAARIARDPGIVPTVLDAAVHFHHFGEQAVADVPVALPGDPLAIRSFTRRIERLCGVRLVDHLKRQL